MSELKLCAFADEASPSVEEQIKALQENGISYIEPRGLDWKNVSELNDEEAKKYAKMFADNGIKVWSIGSPIGKVKLEDDFAAEFDRFKRCIDTGVIMNAECIRIFSFYGVTDRHDEVKDEIFERLTKFVDFAKGSGITVCHENEKLIYGDIAPRCLEIAENVPGIKLIFDGANFVQSNQDPVEAWPLLKKYVKYCHIKDSTPEGKMVPPGFGITGMKDYLADFASMGGGVLTVEPHLSSFVGLDKLTVDDETKRMGTFSFGSGREAFDFAVSSLKKLI